MTGRVALSGEARRARIVSFVAEHWREHGYAPTLREIGDGSGLRSMASVVYQVDQLVAAGRLARAPRIPRSIRLVTS